MSFSSITIRHKKDLPENQYHRTFKYNIKKNSIVDKYFLLCAECFWMASTFLINLSEDQLNRFKKCPRCNNPLDEFPIPNIDG